MKKFSKLTGEKISEEPKEIHAPKSDIERENLRYEIMSLIDDILVIRSNGSVRKQNFNNSVSISGKEDLVDAIMDLISEKNLKAKSQVLESLKSGLMIEKAINNVNKEISTKNFLRENWSTVKKVERFLKTHGQDLDFGLILENWTSRANSHTDIQNKVQTLNKMIEDLSFSHLNKSQLVAMRDSYQRRSKLLRG